MEETALLSPQVVDTQTCVIDCPSMKPDVPQFCVPGVIDIQGWAFAGIGKPVPATVYLEIRSERTGVVQKIEARRQERPDVARHFRDEGLLKSGFLARVPSRGMYGEYSARVCQDSEGHILQSGEILRFRIGLQSFEQTVREDLAAKFLSGAGLEIGALQRKLKVPPECRVTYVDRMPLKELLEHYPEMRQFPVQAPDLIDDGERLGKVAGESQDFVIANHFLEHCENPIQTLENLLRVLRKSGVLYMAVPDRRYTFDYGRPTTTYEILRQTRISGLRPDTARLYREWAECVMHVDSESSAQTAHELLDRGYSIHFNVWTIDELTQFLVRAREDFGIPFEISSMVSAENEVILILSKT